MKTNRNLTRFKRPKEFVKAHHTIKKWKSILRKKNINMEFD